jgi:hypothetical protein
MTVNFSMHGPNLNCIDVLTVLRELPRNYNLWEDEEELKDQNGFTLSFEDVDRPNENIPFGFGRFLVANRDMLQDESLIGKSTIKELSVVVSKEILAFYSKPMRAAFFVLKPSFTKLLWELNIEFHLATEL